MCVCVCESERENGVARESIIHVLFLCKSIHLHISQSLLQFLLSFGKMLHSMLVLFLCSVHLSFQCTECDQ